MRPQSRMANPHQQSQGPQQTPEQSQGSQPPQGTPQPVQAPTPQSAQQQQLTPQQMQGFQQQQQQQQQQRALLQRQQAQQRSQAFQQMQAAQAAAQAQAQTRPSSQTPGFCILKVNLLADDLSRFDMSNGKDLNAWNDFTEKHFAPEGRLMHSFDDNPNAKAKVYEVLRPTIARYFWTYFESGAQSLRLHTEHARENQARNGGSQVSCAHATLTVSYPSGARLEMSGRLNALFVPQGDIPLIECLELQQTSTEEIISRSEIERVLSSFSPQMDTKSPKMTKTKPPKAQQKLQQRFDGLTIDH
ncbi:hypothetical protein KC315_g20022, partial [Hortaea werneckii]